MHSAWDFRSPACQLETNWMSETWYMQVCRGRKFCSQMAKNGKNGAEICKKTRITPHVCELIGWGLESRRMTISHTTSHCVAWWPIRWPRIQACRSIKGVNGSDWNGKRQRHTDVTNDDTPSRPRTRSMSICQTLTLVDRPRDLQSSGQTDRK